MTFFTNILKSLKLTARRFPLLFIFSILSFLCFTVNIITDTFFDNITLENILASCGISFLWCIFLSITLQLIYEAKLNFKQQEKTIKKTFFAGNIISILVSFGLSFFIYNFCIIKNNIYANMFILGTLISLVISYFFLLTLFQNKIFIFPRCICSSILSLFISLCICCGLSIIWLAITSLIFEFYNSDFMYTIIWIAFLFINIACFITFSNIKIENYTCPKSFKIIMHYILLSLYTLLILVLYIYLFKCIFFKQLPNGIINWFVSISTLLYIVFYLSFLQYKSKTINLFYKFGAFLLIPLIFIQVVAFSIRINAYGFTSIRVLSLYYILFSICFIILTFIKKGKFIFSSFLILIFFILLATSTPLNIHDVAILNQKTRMETILKKHDMIKDNTIIPISDPNKLSNKEKEIIVSTFDELIEINDFNLIYSNNEIKENEILIADGETFYKILNNKETNEYKKDSNGNIIKIIDTNDFLTIFGFEYRKNYSEEDNIIEFCEIEAKEITEVDVSNYKKIFYFSKQDYSSKTEDKTIVTINNKKYDFNDIIIPYLKETNDSSYYRIYRTTNIEKPIYWKTDDLEIYITCLFAKKKENSDTFSEIRITGYALK